MLFHSIRWRLQIWYGLILVLVLAGFGFTAYQLQRGRVFRKLDQELQRRTGEIANAMRAPMMRQRNMPGGQMDERPQDRRLPGPDEGPPPEDPMGLGGQGFPPRPFDFRLPPRLVNLFEESDSNGFYYVIWARDGRVLAHSTNAPADIPAPPRPAGQSPQPPRMNGNFREALHALPPGEIILTGKTVAPEFDELNRTAGRLSAVGAVILVLGLVGGWWNATRAIHPIQDISTTAVKIASGDLSHRINVADTDNELGRLATVLNSTFARLEGAFDEEKRFTSDAAHELRTPVTVVLTQTQTALARERSAPEYRETIEACQRAAQRMRKLIESLLALSRLDAGQEPMKSVSFDLAQTAADCVEMMRPLAAEHQVAIQCQLPTLACKGDPDRLGQVITNLLTNAIYYNHKDGNVKVTGQIAAGAIHFSVSNTGSGIAPEDLPHLFKRFYRADKSRTDSRSGLGLAISKAIVEAHGGTIIASSLVGEGATFTIHLPTAA